MFLRRDEVAPYTLYSERLINLVSEDSQSSATHVSNIQSLMNSSMMQGISQQKEKDQK
jgi:hypothetical protein